MPDPAAQRMPERGSAQELIMDDVQPLVLIVDDDESVRRSLRWLLVSAGYAVATFESGTDMLEQGGADEAACVLLDVCMPDMTGIEVKEALARAGRDLVTVFITGRDDVATGVEAMKSGAEDFLLKPFEEQAVLDAVRRAITRDHTVDTERRQAAEIGHHYATLTPREHEVCERVVAGRLNKQIAAELGMCEQTVKVHRCRVMRKMGAGSLADLVRSVDLFHRLNGRPHASALTPLTVKRLEPHRSARPTYSAFPEAGGRLAHATRAD
jgi:FixJ family two-component response regulator